MKKLAVHFCFLILAVGFLAMVTNPSVGRAGSVQAPYQLATWEGFRTAAISYTFDDDCPNQYNIAVPMFHAAGLKMTLFTVTSWVGGANGPTWAQVQNAASYGDEIASHTVTHANLPNLSATQITNELANSQSTINSYITNQSCLTIAYPNCNNPDLSIVAQYYMAGRICSGSLVNKSPLAFYTLSSIILGNTGPYTNGASINSLADNAVAGGVWCVYLIHAIDGDNGYSPLPSSALQASVNYTSTNQSKFWVETFGNVIRYIKERANSSVTETANTGNSITVQVTNTLDNTIFNYPITLRRPLPDGWLGAVVTQNGQPITAQISMQNSTNYATFDIVPNGGDIVLTASLLRFTLSNPALTPPGILTLQLNGQSNNTYALYSSPDLLNWLPLQTNTLVSNSAIFTVDASSNSAQFYRAQWAP